MVEFEKAKDKIMMGAERRSMVMTEAQKESTAYHEAGHAIIGRRCRSTIRYSDDYPARSCAGVTFFLPEGDAISASRQKLKARSPPCTAVVWRKRLSTVRNMFLPVHPTILKWRRTWRVTW